MSVKSTKMDGKTLLEESPPQRTSLPPNHIDISNSTSKKFDNVVAQYMRVHKITSLNPAVVTKAADHTGLQGDSYHQWDEYNPPTPIAHSRTYYNPKIATDEDLSRIITPSMDSYQFDNWSVGDSFRPNASKTIDTTDSKVCTFNLTPTTFIKKEKSSNEECSLSVITHYSAEPTHTQREDHPVIPFLPVKHHLQLPGGASSSRSHNSMTSFWDDYEKTANGSDSYECDLTPMKYLNFDGGLEGSDLSNSAFESQIDTNMEPESLEKKPIMSEEMLRDLSAKNGRHSNTVRSCLPHLFTSEYTESPPYMPSESFKFDVGDNRGTQQRKDINSVSNIERVGATQRNVQHAERSCSMRNRLSDSSRSASVTTPSETLDEPVITPAPCLVFDSLADDLEEKGKKRRNILISIVIMFIGALIHIIGLAILVYIQNKNFAPYNGIYPNGCKDVMLIEGAETPHGVNCSEYLAQRVLS